MAAQPADVTSGQSEVSLGPMAAGWQDGRTGLPAMGHALLYSLESLPFPASPTTPHTCSGPFPHHTCDSLSLSFQRPKTGDQNPKRIRTNATSTRSCLQMRSVLVWPPSFLCLPAPPRLPQSSSLQSPSVAFLTGRGSKGAGQSGYRELIINIGNREAWNFADPIVWDR